MAFLAKKVPKIFPSKTKKGNDDLLPSRHSYNKGKGSSLFRKFSREGETGLETQQHTPVTEKKTHKVLLATGETFDCCGESNNNNNNVQNICSDAHSGASTLESSPTPVPRETMDPTMLVLPDLPTLEFPRPKGHHESNNNNKTTPLLASLRLAPRPIAHDDSNEFPAPPVALISVPMEFEFPPPPPPTTSRVVVASCLTRPPPRAGEWDDATIESQELLVDDDDDEAETDQSRPESSSLSQQQQQQQQQRETTTAQASAIMKPWIERAARLALLQNRACGNYREAEGSYQQRLLADESFAPLIRQRRREAALLNLRPEEGYNPRKLLASLEKGQRDTPRTRTAPKATMDSSKPHSEQSPSHTPRTVRWHVVRQPCK